MHLSQHQVQDFLQQSSLPAPETACGHIDQKAEVIGHTLREGDHSISSYTMQCDPLPKLGGEWTNLELHGAEQWRNIADFSHIGDHANHKSCGQVISNGSIRTGLFSFAGLVHAKRISRFSNISPINSPK